MTDGTLENLRGLRLLIVEDEYTIASDLAHWFEDAGVKVVGPAGSVRKGLAMIAGAPRRKGYGSELIEKALPYQLEAETDLKYGPDGVICSIVVPVRVNGDGA